MPARSHGGKLYGWRRAVLACALVLTGPGMAPETSAARTGALPIAGWLEHARISPGDLVLEAKLDSGARTSSLHASNLQRFERDGKAWVSFEVNDDDGRVVRIERPLVRLARIKSAMGVDEARPTVTLGICVGSVYRVTEVNLVDRDGLAKPLLIGRRFLKGRLLIDSKSRYRLEPQCRRKAVP